ncbi:MAG: CopG family transcriptional regulator [Pseudomonadota bacterium]
MGQVTIYLDAEYEQRLKRAAQAANIPVSRYVARLVEENTRNEWPPSVRELAGQWGDFPCPESLRDGVSAADSPREDL